MTISWKIHKIRKKNNSFLIVHEMSLLNKIVNVALESLKCTYVFLHFYCDATEKHHKLGLKYDCWILWKKKEKTPLDARNSQQIVSSRENVTRPFVRFKQIRTSSKWVHVAVIFQLSLLPIIVWWWIMLSRSINVYIFFFLSLLKVITHKKVSYTAN